MQAFAYHAPNDLAEARALLDADPEARLLAGGMSLLPTMKLGLATPSLLVDLGRIDSLVTLADEGERLCIGAMTTHAAVAHSASSARCRRSRRSPAASVMCRCATVARWCAREQRSGGGLSRRALALDAEVQTDRRRRRPPSSSPICSRPRSNPVKSSRRALPVPRRAIYLKLPQPASRYAVVGVFAA